MHIIYNMYSKYSYYTVPRIIFIKENCSKIDFFFSDQACHNSKMHYVRTTNSSNK